MSAAAPYIILYGARQAVDSVYVNVQLDSLLSDYLYCETIRLKDAITPANMADIREIIVDLRSSLRDDAYTALRVTFDANEGASEQEALELARAVIEEAKKQSVSWFTPIKGG